MKIERTLLKKNIVYENQQRQRGLYFELPCGKRIKAEWELAKKQPDLIITVQTKTSASIPVLKTNLPDNYPPIIDPSNKGKFQFQHFNIVSGDIQKFSNRLGISSDVLIESQYYTPNQRTEIIVKEDLISFDTTLPDGGLISQEIGYQSDTNKLIAYQKVFKLSKKLQSQYKRSGTTIGRDLLREMYSRYKKIGVDIIITVADNQVSGYCFAKYGFDTNIQTKQNFLSDLNKFTGENLSLSPEDHIVNIANIKMYLEDFINRIKIYRSFFKISDEELLELKNEIDNQENYPLGKAYLLKREWLAYLDISSDNEGHRRFKAYTGVE